MNTAIIAAAGSGTRFNSQTPKQFLEILGKPLIVHTLERFDSCPSIDGIILVLPGAEIERFEQIARKYNIGKLNKIVAGGSIRAGSVANGLNALDAQAEDIIAVHDGARPLVTVEEITQTIEKAKETGVACLVAAVTDTIKEIDGGRIIGTIDRTKLRRALTPQAFRYEILQKAFAHGDIGAEVTDECYLVEKLGFEIAFVEGSARNIKITHPEDIALAEMFLKDDL
jgi:2-C-methyl-D-erythritol 4-phosphate cytidylyltransferase